MKKIESGKRILNFVFFDITVKIISSVLRDLIFDLTK